MRSSGSTLAGSRSRRTFNAECRRSQSSGLPIAPVRRPRSGSRSGIASAELEWPLRRITVNLAPAELRKEGSGFDLPIALAVLAASRQVPADALAGHAAVGGWPWTATPAGRRRSCGGRGCAPVGADAAPLRGGQRGGGGAGGDRADARCTTWWRRSTISGAMGPPPVESSRWTDAPGDRRARSRRRERPGAGEAGAGARRGGRAQPVARRPARHGQDDAGAPSAGNPAAPPAGRGARDHEDPFGCGPAHGGAAAGEPPPFRAPHHTASVPRSSAAARLRGPARSSSRITGSCSSTSWRSSPARARGVAPAARGRGDLDRPRGGRIVFPARFQLVGTMNLCPCGARGDPAAECSCSAGRLAAYRDKLSRALLDRFDLVVTVPRPRARDSRRSRVRRPAAGERVRRRANARPRSLSGALQAGERAADEGGGAATAVGSWARAGCSRGEDCRLLAAQEVGAEHVAEALSYRSPTELGTP